MPSLFAVTSVVKWKEVLNSFQCQHRRCLSTGHHWRWRSLQLPDYIKICCPIDGFHHIKHQQVNIYWCRSSEQSSVLLFTQRFVYRGITAFYLLPMFVFQDNFLSRINPKKCTLCLNSYEEYFLSLRLAMRLT